MNKLFIFVFCIVLSFACFYCIYFLWTKNKALTQENQSLIQKATTNTVVIKKDSTIRVITPVLTVSEGSKNELLMKRYLDNQNKYNNEISLKLKDIDQAIVLNRQTNFSFKAKVDTSSSDSTNLVFPIKNKLIKGTIVVLNKDSLKADLTYQDSITIYTGKETRRIRKGLFKGRRCGVCFWIPRKEIGELLISDTVSAIKEFSILKVAVKK